MTDSTTIIFAGETARNVAVALLLSLAGFVCLCMLARSMWTARQTRRKIEAQLRKIQFEKTGEKRVPKVGEYYLGLSLPCWQKDLDRK